MRFHNQCAHWWRKHFHKSAGRPETPQRFRPAQFLPLALKDAAADFNALGYGRTAVPSLSRAYSQPKSISAKGYFAAAFSSKPTPMPGRSLT